MPPLQPVPGVARVVMNATYQTQTSINVFHCQNNAGFQPVGDIQALVVGMRAAYAARFTPLQVSTYVLGTVTGIDLSTITGPLATAPGSTPGAVNATNPLPASTALCVSWAINRHYRGGHPRTYFGGIPYTSILNANTWSATALAAWLAASLGFLADVPQIVLPSGNHYNLVSVHRKRNKTDLIPPELSTITTASVDSRIDSMRRRLGKDR